MYREYKYVWHVLKAVLLTFLKVLLLVHVDFTKLFLTFSQRGDNWKKCNAKLVETENDGLLILESESDKPVTYSLQSCSRVLEARNHYSKENAIELLFQKKVVQLGFDSPDESIEWQKLLSGYSQDSLSHINSATGNTKSRLPSDVANADSSSAEVMEYNVAYELDSTSKYSLIYFTPYLPVSAYQIHETCR